MAAVSFYACLTNVTLYILYCTPLTEEFRRNLVSHCVFFSLFTTEGKKVIKNKASVYIMVVYFDLNWDLNHH